MCVSLVCVCVCVCVHGVCVCVCVCGGGGGGRERWGEWGCVVRERAAVRVYDLECLSLLSCSHSSSTYNRASPATAGGGGEKGSCHSPWVSRKT